MVWDLGKAMQKKEEFESARLMDFEFRQYVRAARLYSRSHGLDGDWIAREMAVQTDRSFTAFLALRTGQGIDIVLADITAALRRLETAHQRNVVTRHLIGWDEGPPRGRVADRG
jgi:hypothetical protein